MSLFESTIVGDVGDGLKFQTPVEGVVNLSLSMFSKSFCKSVCAGVGCIDGMVGEIENGIPGISKLVCTTPDLRNSRKSVSLDSVVPVVGCTIELTVGLIFHTPCSGSLNSLAMELPRPLRKKSCNAFSRKAKRSIICSFVILARGRVFAMLATFGRIFQFPVEGSENSF